MLLILCILYFARGTTYAAPFSLILRDTSTKIDASSSLAPGMQCPPTRSIWDIIWSCFATIFACSWVSIHPNIPPNANWWELLKRRIEYMAWTILVPEIVILWATRQYFGALEISRQFEGWTMTHGHFFQMGGFMLFDGATPQGVLHRGGLYELLNNGSIKVPNITKEEINDRSKNDALAKCILIGQTGWFVLQCIARKVEGLVITELELITLALAALNGFMYFFWWDKPFDVRMPVRVYLIESSLRVRPKQEIGWEYRISNGTPTFFQWLMETMKAISLKTICHRVLFSRGNSGVLAPTFFQQLRKSMKAISLKALLLTLVMALNWPFVAVKAIARRVEELVGWAADVGIPGDREVGIFYSAEKTSKWRLTTLTGSSIIGMIFGAIHCVGWHFVFPTHIELIVWRVCSIIITSIPANIPIFAIGTYVWWHSEHSSIASDISFLLRGVSTVVFVLSGPIYFLARIALLVVAFLSLRNLSEGAYAVVDWTSHFPHI